MMRVLESVDPTLAAQGWDTHFCGGFEPMSQMRDMGHPFLWRLEKMQVLRLRYASLRMTRLAERVV
jgi:hypothetical protein